MNEPNTNFLYSDFPLLYWHSHLTVEESAMPWGFQCRDGRFDIIPELSGKLNSELTDIGLEFVQIKQKSGRVIFQVDHDHTAMDKQIVDAEPETSISCESCGGTNSKYHSSKRHLIVLCDSCALAGDDFEIDQVVLKNPQRGAGSPQ